MIEILFTVLLLLSLSGLPTLAQSPFPPAPQPAATLEYVDLVGVTPDEALTVTTLQGLLNRGEATQVFVRRGAEDDFWLERLETKGYVKSHEALTLSQFLERHLPDFDRVVVYDPALPASINIATMIAGLEEAPVVAPVDLERFAQGKTLIDLRGRWQTNVEAYEWAFIELWPRLSHQGLACYHPTSCVHMLRDYLVQQKFFCFWITSTEAEDGQTSSHEAERVFAEKLLAASPPNIPVLGFWYSGADPGINEYSGVGLAGQYGKYTVVADSSPNLSVLSGIQCDLEGAAEAYQKRLKQRTPPTYDPSKVYVAMEQVESGDSPMYLYRLQRQWWDDPARGAFPVNWSQGLVAFDLMPPVMEYFLEAAGPNDYLYGAISGYAYTHPYRDFMSKLDDPEQGWRDYLALTRHTLNRLGWTALGLYTDAWRPFDRTTQDPTTLRILEGLPEVDTLVMGMGRDGEPTEAEANYLLGTGEVLVTHLRTRWDPAFGTKTREENITWLVEDIRAHTPTDRPAFLSVMALSWAYKPTEIQAVLEALGDEYVTVTLPEFKKLWLEAHTEGRASN